MTESSADCAPVTFAHCSHVHGPFLHGTKAVVAAGDELVAGFESNFGHGMLMNHVYFTTRIETAAWGAQLAAALAGPAHTGRIYVVEPTGPFEDDPNVTDKRYAGNPTESYRTRHPLRVVAELDEWPSHSDDALAAMLGALDRLREEGLDEIED